MPPAGHPVAEVAEWTVSRLNARGIMWVRLCVQAKARLLRRARNANARHAGGLPTGTEGDSTAALCACRAAGAVRTVHEHEAHCPRHVRWTGHGLRQVPLSRTCILVLWLSRNMLEGGIA
jgi:hypothetical protein